jgi:RNA polymerase sigma-70 factor (sigma-E family)
MQGEDERFAAYVSARSRWLRRMAYLLCQDWHRADDLVQTAVTRLYVHWRRAEKVENLDGYTRTVLLRTFFAEQRTLRWRRGGNGAPTPELAAAGSDLEAEMDLRYALRNLPPRQRAAVVLRYYCDLSVEQTAEAMNCSTGNVKSQTARGLAALRRVLETEKQREEHTS